MFSVGSCLSVGAAHVAELCNAVNAACDTALLTTYYLLYSLTLPVEDEERVERLEQRQAREQPMRC